MRQLINARVFAVALAVTLLASCGGDSSGGPGPLSITEDSAPAGTSGVAYAGYTFLASGGSPPLSWTETGPLPPGLAFSHSGQLTGNPASAGKFPISVTVTDSSVPPLSASVPVSLVINDSSIVIAASPSPPAGTATNPYPGFAFTASGGSPPYAWKSSGTVPPGLAFGSDGSLSGTPTTAGTFAFSVTATDSAQTPQTSPPLATQIIIGAPGQLVLNATPAPPAAVEGSGYGPFSFSATGGYLPLQWNITTGSLPPGLTLGNDGSLSGTPTQVGSSNFTVTVQDSSAPPEVSKQTFTINVTAPPPTIVSSEAPTGMVGTAYSFQFVANGGAAPLVWTETGALPGGIGLSPGGTLAGTPTGAGKFPISLDVTDALKQSAAAPLIVRISLARSGSFSTTGSMTTPRSGHSSTLLTTGPSAGKVLVAGGGNGQPDATAELYDPNAGTFTATGSMTEPRIGHTATLLAVTGTANYGKVLIVGSADTSAELYDPTSGKFSATGSLTHARTSPTATLLQTGSARLGSVLIVGGNTLAGDTTAELYDPATGTFTTTGSTTVPRAGHTATQLLDGRVLIAGGATDTAELYDPVSGTFVVTGSMTTARTGATATRLEDGTVLIFASDGTADLYDPHAGTFAAVGSELMKAFAEAASLRSDGSVLAAGGYHSSYSYRLLCGGFLFRCRCLRTGPYTQSLSTAELFGPESGGFTATSSLQTPRDGHTATVLPGGAVLVIGGTQHTATGLWPYQSFCRVRPPPTVSATVLSSAELFK